MTNLKTKIAALIMIILAAGPYIFPHHDALWASLTALAAALGFGVTRQSGDGSQAPGGPIEQGLRTQAEPFAIDPQNSSRIIR
jgi:hypothetical protein